MSDPIISLRTTFCHAGCGATVIYKTTPIVLCDACRPARMREKARLSAEVQRRKRGIPKIKGTTINCQLCGCVVVRDRMHNAKFCPSCYLKQNGVEARVRSENKRATPEGREYLNNWHKAKHRDDPQWAISSRVRSLMHRGIGKAKGGRSWKALVPYSIEELMAHLERQFLPGMTWDNRGKWHIDHILPLSSFEFETPEDPEFHAAWSLSNLRPLWALDNIRKNSTRTHLL